MSKSLVSRFAATLGIIGIAIAVGGCVSIAPNLKGPADLVEVNKGKDRSLVFGRIQYLLGGNEQTQHATLGGKLAEVGLIRMGDGAWSLGEITETGNFVWALRAGTYLISTLHYRDTWSGEHYTNPKIAFRIPENERVYYIGTLRADIAPERNLLGELRKVNLTIQDDAGRDLKPFRDKFNVSSIQIQKSLMLLDERLPAAIPLTDKWVPQAQAVVDVMPFQTLPLDVLGEEAKAQ